MSTIKLVLTDMDGTVVSTLKHEVSDAVREAIIAAEKQGVIIAAVTARPYELAKGVLSVLGIEGPCVIDGGATIVRPVTGEIIWRQWLDPATIKQVVSVYADTALTLDYFPEHRTVSSEEITPEEIDWQAPYIYGTLPMADIARVQQRIEGIQGVVSHRINLYNDEVVGLQVTHRDADKSHGVAHLCSILGVARQHTLGIGDGDNDVPLFKNAGLKVAMGNATPGLKEKADHIVASLDNDGFAEAMHRFVLL